MKGQVWFTSDSHLGHAGMLRHLRPDGARIRDFPEVAAMDEALIERWNERVRPGDTVWHLGDFTLAGAAEAEGYLARLRGRIHLIWGNHDRNSVRRLARWASSAPFAEISVGGRRITLCHYAMRTWAGVHRGALMFYGHSHGNLPGNAQSLDVGADAWDLRPVNLDEILERMASLSPYMPGDHHLPDA